MSYRVTPFRREDLAGFVLQESQRDELMWAMAHDFGEQIEASGNGFTMWRGDEPVLCGGALERHAGYATLWALFSANRPKVPVWQTRRVREFVAGLPHRRVDALVAGGNVRARLWANLIGLRMECVLHAAGIDGEDMVVLVRRGLKFRGEN